MNGWAPGSAPSILDGGTTALLVRAVTPGATLRGLTIQAAAATGAGQSSIGVLVDGCDPSFVDVVIFAGAAGPGLAGAPGATDGDGAARLLALLGIVGGPGTVALVGEPARAAAEVARALPEMHVVAIDPDLRTWPEQERVSRLVAAPGLPFFPSSLRGVALDGRLGRGWLAEAARVVAPRGRVVIVHAFSDARARLESEGLHVVAADAETIVAARS